MSRHETNQRVVEDALCPGCALLCDDLKLTIDGDRVQAAEGGCATGRAWFEGVTIPLASTAADLDAAISRAGEILAQAKAPAIWGLSQATIEAQRAAVAIADRVGAFIGIDGFDHEGLQAFQRVGEVSATYGEVRDRADVIVYDATRGGRIPERFLDRIVPPRKGRTIVWIGPAELELHQGIHADLMIDLHHAKQSAFYQGMRALINGAFVDRSRLEQATGIGFGLLEQVSGVLKGARYGVFVRNHHHTASSATEAKLKLVRDLNAFGRFVAIHPGSRHANLAGAKAVLAWQSGAAGEADFSLGIPRYLPGDFLEERIKNGEVDAILEVGGNHESPALGSTIPRIVIRSTPRSEEQEAPEVEIVTACPAIDEGGSMLRPDGVMLPLRPIWPGRRVTQRDVLQRIEARLKEAGR